MDSWQLLPYTAPVNPVHAALLRTGKIFFVSGSGNDPSNEICPNCSAVLNLSTGTFTQPATPIDPANGFVFDLFCGGHSFLADGRLLFAGGTLQYDPFHGEFHSFFFNPSTEQWTIAPQMAAGRWYPTLVTLRTGRVLAVSGLNEYGQVEDVPSIYSDSAGTWTYFSNNSPTLFPLYAHLFLLSSGNLFYSGAYFDNNQGATPRIITIPSTFAQAITEKAVPGLQAQNSGNQAASVLLPTAQDQKVMIMGGGGGGVATNRVNVVDLTAANPVYITAPSLTYARMHHSAVLLPDRTVLVCNGSTNEESENQSRLPVEIYNPATNTWAIGATPNVPRVYHSVAVLLPDGSVLTAGGNPARTFEERRIEIYRPDYMTQPRPAIGSASTKVGYGGTITIPTAQAASIRWVSLIKPMATTHGLDTEQRVVDVPIASRTSTSLTATVTTNRNLAPPGYYMLFITDQNNVPSVAKWIRLN